MIYMCGLVWCGPNWTMGLQHARTVRSLVRRYRLLLSALYLHVFGKVKLINRLTVGKIQ